MVKNVDPNYDTYRRQKSSIKSCLVINMYTFVKYDAGLSLWRVFSARYSGDHVWIWNVLQFTAHDTGWSQPLRQANTVWWNPDWLYDVCLMSAHVYHCTKNSGGFPNTCWKSDTITRQMHAVLVLFRPLPNVDIQNFGMWGMYNLAKAYGNIENPFANRRVKDWEASNGHTKDTTRLFHSPWHKAVGELFVRSHLGCGTDSVFIHFLQVSQIFQRCKNDANKQDFLK